MSERQLYLFTISEYILFYIQQKTNIHSPIVFQRIIIKNRRPKLRLSLKKIKNKIKVKGRYFSFLVFSYTLATLRNTWRFKRKDSKILTVQLIYSIPTTISFFFFPQIFFNLLFMEGYCVFYSPLSNLTYF